MLRGDPLSQGILPFSFIAHLLSDLGAKVPEGLSVCGVLDTTDDLLLGKMVTGIVES